MLKQKHSALVLGSTGLIGNNLLRLLLNNDNYETVYAVTRKPLSLTHPKLITILADKSSISSKIASIAVDHLFSCLGSTKSKTPDEKEYYAIDHDYPIQVAKIAKDNGCNTICLVSSIGANRNASNFYLKLKGQTEDDIINLGMSNTHVFRPSLLKGNRTEKRTFEKISLWLSPLLDFLMIGKLKNYKSIESKIVAKAMVTVALQNRPGVHIYKTEEIKNIA